MKKMLEPFLADIRTASLHLVHGAVHGDNLQNLELVSSPTGDRLPDNQFIDALDGWYAERFNTRRKDISYLVELAFRYTSLEPGLVLATYISHDDLFDRAETDKTLRRTPAGKLRYMLGTRLTPAGLDYASRHQLEH